jgi:hypothetical protein
MSDLTVVSDPIWGEPEQVDPASISIEGERLPIDEDVVAAITRRGTGTFSRRSTCGGSIQVAIRS